MTTQDKIIHYDTRQYKTIQGNTIQPTQHIIIQYKIRQYYVIHDKTIQDKTKQYNTI